MKLKKTQILKELSTANGNVFWNNTKIIGGIKVARVCWHDNQYKVIDKNANFDEVSNRNYKPIKSFYYQAELAKYIFENQI